jgi:hypothetical protein
MFTYNEKNYQDFAEFAKSFKTNAFRNLSFDENVTNLQALNTLKASDFSKGAYSIYGVKFFVSNAYVGVETSATGKATKRSRRLVKFEGDEDVYRFDDICQLQRMIVAQCNAKGLTIPEEDLPEAMARNGQKRGRTRNTEITAEFIRAKVAEFAEFIKQFNITFDGVAVALAAVENFEAQKAKAETQAKAESLRKLGFTEEQISAMLSVL